MNAVNLCGPQTFGLFHLVMNHRTIHFWSLRHLLMEERKKKSVLPDSTSAIAFLPLRRGQETKRECFPLSLPEATLAAIKFLLTKNQT